MELLSEFESNGSSLLMKHRDHYTHSVFVFALGLAIYETNEKFRRAFNSYYHFDQAEDRDQEFHKAAHFFLEYWGITSLFHDIGYPFELTFEQVMAFFEAGDDDRTTKNPFIVYKNMGTMTEMSSRAQERFEKMYGRKFRAIDELLAFDLTQKLGSFYGFSEEIPEKNCIQWLWNLISVEIGSSPDTCTTKRSRNFPRGHWNTSCLILIRSNLSAGV